ncbi:Hypothetical protein, putative [Bodo saltans]|uniref:Uncharacterized protein n=1 Tax=Bodo saltans TaxID=75058 RepID=A0A0S4K0P4_BODSA|nr:Hypothetical protein, putative [Bodo saltans]|eukprot:CUG94379.1 Hypothetical protein, putative [Bodo saltans]
MSSLVDVLEKHGMRAESQLLDSNRSAFPPFAIQLHGITDAPYFSGSTRVRVFLAHPAQGTSLLREDQRDSTTNTTDDDDAVSLSRYVEVFSALHPEGNHADAQAMGETNLPVLDAVQADAAECCAPWFSGSGSFAFVDGNIMCHPDHPIKASVVAVALVDIIDRRTSMSIGCVGGCTIHLNGRNGVMSYSIRRKVRVRQQPNSDGSSSLWLSISGDALPLTTLVAEVHWGAECSSRPNAVTAKKLRALMFGAIPVEHQVRLGPCLTRSATTSQEDRRRLLYQNSAYRSMRPVDIRLTAETAKIEFDRVNGIASAQGGVVMASRDVIESLGFLVFNLRRGATLTIHGLEEIEPLPVKGVGRSATTHATSNNTVLAPTPSLAHLMLFRVVVEGNDVVVGQTVRHNWDASLLRPSFPSKSNTFRFSEDTMMDDDDDDESNHRNHSAPATTVALDDEEDDGTRAFKDLGELRAVTAMVRVFAMVPNYRKLEAEAATSSGGANNQRSSSSSASLLSRFGFDHFEPMNPTHYQVIPYAWGVVDIVAPDQPFIKCKQFEPLTLYRGKPTSEVLQALQPLLRATTTTATLRRKTKHLHDVMKQLKDDKLLPAQAMRTRLSISVNDASMHVSHPDRGGGGRGAGDAGDDELQHDRLSLQRGWLGLSRRDVTIPQVEECLEATFRAFVFE